MISYFKNSEIDREQWDNCIKKTHRAKPYAYSWFLDVMAPGWEALVDHDYNSVFPIPAFSKFGIKYSSTPAFIQQLGAYSPDKQASEALYEFIDFLPEFYKLIDICVGEETEYRGFKVTERDNLELDLTKPYEIIRDSFSAECKKYIDSISKKKYEIVNDVNPAELTDLFLSYRENNSFRIKLPDIKRIICLMEFCLKNNKGKMFGVRGPRKRLLYGIFVIETHGNKTMLIKAGVPDASSANLGYYVINEIIRTFATSRTTLDFAGTSFPYVDSCVETFGCSVVPFFRMYRNRLFLPGKFLS